MGLGRQPKHYEPAHCDKCGKVTERTRVGVCLVCNTATLAKARANRKTSHEETGRKSWETRRARAAAGLMGIEYNKRNPVEGQKLVEMAREKVASDAVVLFKKHAHAAADTLIKLLTAEDSRPEIKLAAAREILDRSLGKAVQQVVADVTMSEGLINVTPEALRLAALRVAGLTADDAEAA